VPAPGNLFSVLQQSRTQLHLMYTSKPPTRSGKNVSAVWPDETTEHHNVDDIPYFGVSGGPYKSAYGARRWHVVRW